MPQVTKNIIIINVLMFLATLLFQNQFDLGAILGAYPFNSLKFQSYQIVTHFFMHSGFMHILFNMYALYIFGSYLEHVWGAKRFFVVYIASALGAYFLYAGIDTYHIMQMQQEVASTLGGDSLSRVNLIVNDIVQSVSSGIVASQAEIAYAQQIAQSMLVPMVGASGAVFGILAAFAVLFPNMELFLLFIPFPIKAKYLIGGYFVLEVYLGFQQFQGDSVAHFAHVGGAIVGFIFVKLWQKRGNQF
jgi:rhomboid-like protein